jgi:hypothetical protein
MAASRDRVLKRVTELLNLCDAGSYSAMLSSRNKTRNEAAIADFTDEAGLMILKAIAERPNEFRFQFLADSSPITVSGNQMPPHLGPPARVAITLSTGGIVRDGSRLNFQKIQSYRENPRNVYDRVAHDQPNSSLSGHYDIWEDRFYFTGYSAVLSLGRLPVRADNATLIPEILENIWIKLAVGEASKVGVGGYQQTLISGYAQAGKDDLELFKAGDRTFKEVDDPQPTSAVHEISK